jgi:hypothetical protein
MCMGDTAYSNLAKAAWVPGRLERIIVAISIAFIRSNYDAARADGIRGRIIYQGC